MNSEEFTEIFYKQMSLCEDVLVDKAREYATNNDRLHNFRIQSALRGSTLRSAVADFMGKHTVSIYDMCNSEVENPVDMWSEKITDHINYLIILRAVIEEEKKSFEQDSLPFNMNEYAINRPCLGFEYAPNIKLGEN